MLSSGCFCWAIVSAAYAMAAWSIRLGRFGQGSRTVAPDPDGAEDMNVAILAKKSAALRHAARESGVTLGTPRISGHAILLTARR